MLKFQLYSYWYTEHITMTMHKVTSTMNWPRIGWYYVRCAILIIWWDCIITFSFQSRNIPKTNNIAIRIVLNYMQKRIYTKWHLPCLELGQTERQNISYSWKRFRNPVFLKQFWENCWTYFAPSFLLIFIGSVRLVNLRQNWWLTFP